MKVQIFAMTHKAFVPPQDPMYVPLQVGRACHEPLGYAADHTGDSISALNAYYSELTGVYWLWKNYRDTDAVGICHYRRYFIAEDGHLYTKADIEQLLMSYDMVVTKKLVLRMPYYDGFSSTHDEKDLLETARVVEEKYPDYAPLFQKMVHKRETYFANMMICRKPLYDQYCAWLFDILFEVQKRTDPTGYDNYRKRVYGFLSEFLLTVWIAKNNLHVFESCVGMSAEKSETEEIKLQLSSYFAKKDFIGAKKYLLHALDNRPDLLMEASDIRGELKLCMQIIATCEYEQSRGELPILEQGMPFAELLKQMRQLNQFAERLRAEEPNLSADTDAFQKKLRVYTDAHRLSATAGEISALVICGTGLFKQN